MWPFRKPKPKDTYKVIVGIITYHEYNAFYVDGQLIVIPYPASAHTERWLLLPDGRVLGNECAKWRFFNPHRSLSLAHQPPLSPARSLVEIQPETKQN